MFAIARPPLPASLAALLVALLAAPAALAGPKPETFWQVDDVHPGMKGQGKTVMHGTKVEAFDAEVLGVLKNTSPGRDMVLCRLSGLNLDKTGVIAGMSGSPVYLDGKLLGAVAYAWAYGKEPIAGVTPFCQMHGYVEAFERRDLAEDGKPRKVGLLAPVTFDGQTFDSVTVSQGFDAPEPGGDGLWMVPLRTPLAATGFSARSLALLGDRLKGTGLVPVQGGGAAAKIAEEEKDTALVPGGPLAVALIQGDFDLSGIGTVTHIEGNRVYGWGHPFMGLGACDFPLMTGYIHTVYPRQTVSFKMGSPLKNVGLINADVSTCIAGWLGRKPDLMPLRMTVVREPGSPGQTFNVEVVRQRSLLPSLVFAALTNSVDMEGDLPEEMTALMKVSIAVEGQKEPIVIQDTFSGSSYSGSRAPQALYNQVASVVGQLTYNPYQPLRVNRIDAETQVLPGRRTAEVEAIELESETCAPGETLRANVFLRPFRGELRRVRAELKLPADLPEGSYTATVCDEASSARADLRDNPNLNSPRDLAATLEALRVQTAARRTTLALRVPTPAVGVAVDGRSLPDLPPSMVQVLGSTRRSGALPMTRALVARQGTEWVLVGSESVKFTVTKTKKVLPASPVEGRPAD